MTIKKCKLVVRDEVNVTFEGLDPKTRRECKEALSFFIHAARHMPAYKLGRWDGCVSFFALNGNTYVNLLDKVLEIIVANGYDIELEDNRPSRVFEFPFVDDQYIIDNCTNPVWPKGHPAAGKPIQLRDYQVNIIREFLENPQCIQEIATGSGKTLITASLSHLCEPHGRTVVIVPNRSLVDQTEADYKNLGLDVGVYYGDRKEPGHQHTICTWQSLHILDKNSKKPKANITQLDIDTFTKDVVAVMADECLAPGTLIRTPDGFKPIEKFIAGDAILSFDEAKRVFVEDKVVTLHTNLLASSKEKMYEICMEDNRILHITGNHKVLTIVGWKRVDQLQIGDDILDYAINTNS